MRDDRDPLRYGDSGDPYDDDTEVVRHSRRIEPEPVEIYEERYVEPAPVYQERYVNPAPVVEESYVERRKRRDPRYTLARIGRVIYFIFGVIEALIAIRVVLRLLGANPRSGFASFIYNITGPFVAPFRGLFNEPALSTNQVLEFSSIVAIIVYALLAYAIVRLLHLFR